MWNEMLKLFTCPNITVILINGLNLSTQWQKFFKIRLKAQDSKNMLSMWDIQKKIIGNLKIKADLLHSV